MALSSSVIEITYVKESFLECSQKYLRILSVYMAVMETHSFVKMCVLTIIRHTRSRYL